MLFAVILSIWILRISAAPAPITMYAVIVDAGSSGSRIYVYKYDSTLDVPNLEQIKDENGKAWAYKKEPGISSLAEKLDEVEAYMTDLIRHVKDEVPASSFPSKAWSQTPFMWFATAGMRLLPTLDADDLTHRIREVAENKQVVPFLFKKGWARTLSGEEEGAFAWISLNYLRGFFTQDGVEDYGVVETGGASTQMTFLTEGNILSNKFNVIINQKLYPLYTHSYLYFGQEQVIKRIFTNECLCKPGNIMVDCRPCMENDGANRQPVKSACLIKDYTRTHTITYNGRDEEISLVGTGDPSQCAKEIDYLFRPNYDCFTRPCAFAGIYQPPFGERKKFFGASAIRYAVLGVGLLKGSKDVTWPQIRNASDQLCQQPLESLDTSNKYAWSRCLAGLYVSKEFEHLQFSRDHKITIEDFDTWTIGAVLYQLELMEILLNR